MEPFKCFTLDNAELNTRLDCTIEEAIAEAIDFAHQGQGALVSFTFNDVDVVVSSMSDAALILRDYRRVLSGQADASVGPWSRRSGLGRGS